MGSIPVDIAWVRSKGFPVIVAATLFGIATPVIKMELSICDPLVLAAFLYLGAGAGILIISTLKTRRNCLTRFHCALRSPSIRLAGTIVAGGIVAPVIQFTALSITPAATAALLLNFEIIATAVFAWGIFHEQVTKNLLIAIVAVLSGSLILSWDAGSEWGFSLGAIGIICSCIFWGLDNNLMGTIRTIDPETIVIAKGLVGGGVLFLGAISFHAPLPDPCVVLLIVFTGFLTFGLGLVFLIESLKSDGAAVTAAYYATAPLIGAFAALALVFEVPGPLVFVSLLFFIAGVVFLLLDRTAGTRPEGRGHPRTMFRCSLFPKIRTFLGKSFAMSRLYTELIR